MGIITEEPESERPGGRSAERYSESGLGRRSRPQREDAEITLGMRSLLGIFFALVLVCGIFFGLGYSVGRSGWRASLPGAASNEAKVNPEKTPEELTPAPADSAPAAANAPSTTPAGTTTETEANIPPPTAQSSAPAPAASPETATAKPAAPPAPAKAAVTTPVAAAEAAARPKKSAATQTQEDLAQAASPVASSRYMVQIAAIRQETDASVLVKALQRRGFNAMIRREPQDNLWHVQLGPFATRTQAFNMRSRLLADGYNAIVK